MKKVLLISMYKTYWHGNITNLVVPDLEQAKKKPLPN